MKKISKSNLNEAIAAVRHFHDVETSSGDKDALHNMMLACRTVEIESGIGVCVLSDLIVSIVCYSGLKRDATNEDIYKVLEVLGWEVE